MKELGLDVKSYKAQLNLVEVVSGHINMINDSVEAMLEARKKANDVPDAHKRALKYCHEVKP